MSFYGMPVSDRHYPINRLKPKPAKILTTFDAGVLVPLWVKECVPGDRRTVVPAFSLRSQTPLHPVFDDAYMDLFVFFCPARHQFDQFVNEWGELDGDHYWVDTTDYLEPAVVSGENGFLPYSVADYFGLPLGVAGLEANAIPFRAYVDIWNTYFRDKNTMPAAARPTDDQDVTSPTTLASDNPWLTAYKGGGLLPVCRLPDYFSTCLPGPQRSLNPVTLPLNDVPITQLTGDADGHIMDTAGGVFSPNWWYEDNPDAKPGRLSVNDSGVPIHSGADDGVHNYPGTWLNGDGDPASNDIKLYLALKAATSQIGISVNDLRFSFALQKSLERMTFAATYAETLKAFYGIDINDGRMQRPELFGWRRFRLNQNQVAQTSAAGEGTTPLGHLAAYSLTVGMSKPFNVPAPEHGFLIALCCIRVDHRSYEQGLERMWSRRDRWDHWNNLMRSIGNQPVFAKEIYAGNATTHVAIDPERVFGFQDYGADYRFNYDHNTGEMRVGSAKSLSSWHYGDFYGSTPSLSSGWMKDNSKDLIDRTLAVTSADANQFFGAFQFGGVLDTEVSLYSIPGYVDHY